LIITEGDEEDINRTVMALESNIDVISNLRDFYVDIVEYAEIPVSDESRKLCKSYQKQFTLQLNEIIADLKTQVARAQGLAKLITERKNIVSQLPCRLTREAEDAVGGLVTDNGGT
jgi:hypothetical protein